LQGNLVDTNTSTVNNLTARDISYISCNPNDYNGFLNAVSILQQAMGQHNLSAVILYSTVSDFCGYEGVPSPLQDFPLFSMTRMQDSQTVLNDISNLGVSSKFFVKVSRVGGDDDSDNSNRQQGNNPLGPSPSTAVAMIILYSITGIITALFLVIIITGAVRAHRHPDRYGPRDVLGRPRQSRARGLGRAILDTIPIVKFGQQETPKPTDVELGPTAEARNVNENANTTTPAAPDGTAGAETNAVDRSSATDRQHSSNAEETPSGIAPAQPPVAATAITATENSSSMDQGLGCSICTDDFEKGQDIRVLPCNHKFHPECVDPWLLNVSGTCPLW
jgi:hypothetical protein